MNLTQRQQVIADEPAFPKLENDWNREALGLSRRELFAAMAMQGIFIEGMQDDHEIRELAKAAVIAADMLIAELHPD